MDAKPAYPDYDAARQATPTSVLNDIYELDQHLCAWLSKRLAHFADVDEHITIRDFNSGDPEGTWHGQARQHAAALELYATGEDDRLSPALSLDERIACLGQTQRDAQSALRWVADNLERLWI